MDFEVHRKKRQHLKITSNDLLKEYPHPVSFYKSPPSNEITLDEFETYAVDRLKILRILEFALHKNYKIYSEPWKQFIYDEMIQANLKDYVKLFKSTGSGNPNEVELKTRRIDYISHFILRYAYSRNEDLRKWFISRELELFHLRFSELSHVGIQKFLALNGFNFQTITESQKEELRHELQESTGGKVVIDHTTFYKIEFEQVLKLVKQRKVFLKAGFAYVPSNELVSCIQMSFRSNLSAGLTAFFNRFVNYRDDRFSRFLNHLDETSTSNDFGEALQEGAVKPENIDVLARDHFPLCMRHIHDTLKIDHHLKHFARLQYLLFLKGIGLDYDDCMQFWKEEFTKKIDSNTFDKQYAYLVKHSYGKVGSMINYAPHSCMKIITSSVGPGEHHGCPFKHWDKTNLTKRLEDYGCSSEAVNGIMEKVIGGHYQIACLRYFEASHKVLSKDPINHPNQYFTLSYNLKYKKDDTGNEKDVSMNTTELQP